MRVNMNKLRDVMSGPQSTLGAVVCGVIGVAGLAMAISMTSCDAGAASRAARSGNSGSGNASSRELPRVPGFPNTAAGRSSGPSGPAGSGDKSNVPAAATGEPEVRVRVMSAIDTVNLSAQGGLSVGSGEVRGLSALVPGMKMDRIGALANVSLRAGQWIVSENPALGGASGAAVKTYPATQALMVRAAEAARPVVAGTLTLPGTLRLTARTDVRDGAFDVVEFVGVEDYLPGVVGKEMLAGWPLGTYQAQAVAARTYALQERERSIAAGQAFDLESTDRDQVYGGLTTNAAAREAVRSTRGEVLKDGDKLLRAYYSSTCGGRTASARDTWPTGPGFEYNLAGPLQASKREFACQGSPLFRWNVERPKDELVQRLRMFGERQGFSVRRLKDLAAIEPMTINSEGRTSRFKIIEPGGAWYQLSAEEMRLASNTNVPAGRAGGLTPLAGTTLSAMQPGASGGADGGAAAGAPIADIDRRSRVHSSDFDVTIRGNRVVFAGRGFGHGVGLCQYCARAFGERGDSYKTMLERFYPGAKLVDLY